DIGHAAVVGHRTPLCAPRYTTGLAALNGTHCSRAHASTCREDAFIKIPQNSEQIVLSCLVRRLNQGRQQASADDEVGPGRRKGDDMLKTQRFVAALVVAGAGIAMTACTTPVYAQRGGGGYYRDVDRRAYDVGYREGIRQGENDARRGRD